MYNFNHLYYFYITAKSGSFTVAAKHLKVSQPSLSSQIKVLEQSLELKLFQKVGRNNQLTQAGLVIYGFCRQMFELSEEMGELISKRVPTASRRIHVGVSDEVDRAFVVEVVSLFLKKHGLTQRPRVSMVSGSHDQLADRLRFRELDAVVTQTAMSDPDLVNLESAAIPVALTCSAKWKTTSKTRTLNAGSAIKALIGGDEAQWVMPVPSFKLRAEIDHFFETNALKGRIVFESDVMASLVRSVVDEIGLAFLPTLYIAKEVREKNLRILGPKNGFWKYSVWLSCHKQNQDDILIQSLSRSFKGVCAQAIY